MRKRGAPPSCEEALELVTRVKLVGERRSELEDELRRNNTVERGTKHWCVELRLSRGVLKAAFKIDNRTCLNLDHHPVPVRGGIPVGYHWDVRQPFRPGTKDDRVLLEPQPATWQEALDVLCQGWALYFEPEEQEAWRW